MGKRIRAWTVHMGAIVRRVIGAPDYERYLSHMRERHPDQRPLAQREFLAACLSTRYDRPGSRCC